MKSTKTLILAAVLALFAGESYADSGSKTTPCYTVGKNITVDSGCTLTVKSGGTLNLNSGSTETNQATKSSGGSADVSGIVFSNGLTGNPMTQTTFQSFTAASASAGINVLNSTAGRTIFPTGGMVVMVSGTASGATSLNLECQPSHTIIATWPAAELVNGIPVGLYASSATVLGSGLGRGCSASDAVQLSANSLATTTQVFITMPYTVQ